jgi:hypothetical protein
MLKQAHFPSPVEADLSDLEGYNYPERISIPEKLAENEALNVIKELAKDKALDPDGIPNRVLKRVAGVTPTLLTRIFQAYINQGVHPRQWKKATTVLLRKPGKSDYSNPSAYRLITLLNTLEKILEAVIARRIRYAVEAHKLLPETQMGARRGRLTETALHLLTEKIYTIWAGNKPRIASILSLDVVGAFDRVSHTRLAHNLRKRKIPETLVR